MSSTNPHSTLTSGIDPMIVALRHLLQGFALTLVSRPNTGKGELAKFLEKFGFLTISTSKALRDMAAMHPGDPEWEEVLQLMSKGKLVDKKYVVPAVVHALSILPPNSVYVFDGFPRDNAQAPAFQEVLHQTGLVGLTLELQVSRDEANRRRLKRIDDAEQLGFQPREDDTNIDVWNDRQDIYETAHPDLHEALHAITHYCYVDASDQIEVTRARALEILFTMGALLSQQNRGIVPKFAVQTLVHP